MSDEKSPYRYLPIRTIERSYTKAMRKYERYRNQNLTYLANDYLEEAKRLADEIDRRKK